MLHDYSEFNNFVDRMLTEMEQEINDESGEVQQKDKEAYENVKTIRSELGSAYEELKRSITSREKVKTMTHLTVTLDLLEKLQDLAETLEEGLGEFLLNLGIDYLHSTVERIISKTNQKPKFRSA
jgi:phosphoenolpyruvate carboxylase